MKESEELNRGSSYSCRLRVDLEVTNARPRKAWWVALAVAALLIMARWLGQGVG